MSEVLEFVAERIRCRRWYAAVLFLLFVVSLSSLPARAQLFGRNNARAEPEPPAEAKAEEPEDPLGRATPRGTVMGFLHAAQSGNPKDATQYLQLSADERKTNGDKLVHQLHELMDHAFLGRVGPLSDRREGTADTSLPRNRERIGDFRLSGSTTPVELVRVSDGNGKEVWLFSSQILSAVPDLYTQLEVSKLDAGLPRFLSNKRVFSTPLWRWLAFLLLIPIAWGLARGIVSLFLNGERILQRLRNYPMARDLHSFLGAPATLILGTLFHKLGVAFLGLPLLFRMSYHRITGIMLVVGGSWLIFRFVNRWGEFAKRRAKKGSGYRSDAIMLLGQRIVKVVVVIVAVFLVFSIFGFDMTTVVAGLGIGGVMVAFAAQKTLENLLGGVSVLTDEVIRVGDNCRVGDRVGSVEDISLRSTRIRTLQRTELSVPNGELASINVENLSRRDKYLFEQVIHIRHDTTADQLRRLLGKIRDLLEAHPMVEAVPSPSSIRLIAFGESSLDLEISCHVLTRELSEFRAIREGILLQIMDLVQEVGTSLAVPARDLLLPNDIPHGKDEIPREEERGKRPAPGGRGDQAA